MQKMQDHLINNSTADELILHIQGLQSEGKHDPKAFKRLMDLVSNIKNYDISDMSRQGLIGKTYYKEIARRLPNSNDNGSTSFSIGFEDVVAVFWDAVLKHIPKAVTTGTSINVREVPGQYIERATSCNPVYYLRNIGIMHVRNTINSEYRKHLHQVCNQCNYDGAIHREEITKNCVYCRSSATNIIWPDKKSSYSSTKMRECLACHKKYNRKFDYICISCKSQDVSIESKDVYSDATLEEVEDVNFDLESVIDNTANLNRIHKIIEAIGRTIPKDPANPSKESRTAELYDILMNPEDHRDICRQCVASAPKVCPEGCKGGCQHELIPDPKVSCGATTFSLLTCTNFAKKIGQYHNCAGSLASRRMQNIRKYFTRYIELNHTKDDVCNSIYNLMKTSNLAVH